MHCVACDTPSLLYDNQTAIWSRPPASLTEFPQPCMPACLPSYLFINNGTHSPLHLAVTLLVSPSLINHIPPYIRCRWAAKVRDAVLWFLCCFAHSSCHTQPSSSSFVGYIWNVQTATVISSDWCCLSPTICFHKWVAFYVLRTNILQGAFSSKHWRSRV